MAHDRYHFRSAEAVSGFDEGGHTCLPAGLAIADVPVGDISLGSRRPSLPGAGHGPHPWAKSHRDPNEMMMMTMMMIPGTGLGMQQLWGLYIFVLQSSQIAFQSSQIGSGKNQKS